VAKLRVLFGFVMAAAFLWFSAPDAISLAIGVPISTLGLGLRAWAAGHLEKNRTLAQSGPYAMVRNPLYMGTLTVAAGLAVAARRWELAVLFAVVFGLVYLPAVELEEQHLRGLFPEFAEYANRVPRLIPRFGGDEAATPVQEAGRPFQFDVYRRNREYEALAGFMVGVMFLVWKAVRGSD
jgi:protein-S-isoprenylcysteine O-methyltransferase Ste14